MKWKILSGIALSLLAAIVIYDVEKIEKLQSSNTLLEIHSINSRIFNLDFDGDGHIDRFMVERD